MIDRSVLGIFMILLLAPCGFGQQYYPTVEQQGGSGGVRFQSLPSNSLELPGLAQYAGPATPYAPTYATTSPQFATPQINASVPTYAAPYVSPYGAPNTSPYYATTPPQLPTPKLAPQIDTHPNTEQPQSAEPNAPQVITEEVTDESMLVEEEPPRAWYRAPVYWFDLWEGNVEMGMSGSDGNSQTLNYLLGLDAKRETDQHILDFDLKYDRKTANSVDTAHRLFAEARWELLFEDSCWTWFFHETTEYDEFKAFDLRLSYDTGLGRCLIKNDDTSLLARAAAGMSHEIGGLSDNLVPEGVFGLEFDHKLNERQKLSFSSEYSPDVTDFLDYRLKSKASWEVLLDEDTNLSLKASILDRYDSTPSGKKANDVDYTLTLLWSF